MFLAAPNLFVTVQAQPTQV